MKAVIYKNRKESVLVTDRPVPQLRDTYVLVKVVANALNPTDWKHVYAAFAQDGNLLGVDYAGTVEEVGKGVTLPWKKGDRICGFANGANILQPEDGTFAEQIVVRGDVQMKIPSQMSFEDASTLGCGVLTVGQGLFQEQGLKLSPPSKPISTNEPVLIYGGATATGTLGIQFLKLAGYKVLTTCSPKNFDLVKSLGADEVFDYKDPSHAQQIREATNDKLKYAWDCVSTGDTDKYCGEALSSQGPVYYGTILQGEPKRSDCTVTRTLAYTAVGEELNKFGQPVPANPSHLEDGKKWIAEVQGLLDAGKIKVHPVRLGPGGLEGVIQGMKDMRDGKYAGEKLVYKMSETP